MSLQRDWILRLIEHLAEAIGRWARGEASEEEVVAQMQGLTGLTIERIDMMPAAMLRRVLLIGDRGEAKLAALADALDALARYGDPALADARRAKAAALRA